MHRTQNKFVRKLSPRVGIIDMYACMYVGNALPRW